MSDQVSDAPESAVYRCARCDLVYLHPIMTQAEEAGFYLNQFEKYMEGRSGAGWKSPELHFQSYQAEGERRVPLVRPHVRPDDDVLEIGSSTGYFLDDLRGGVKSVTGVEPSDAYRAFAESRGIETVRDIGDLGTRSFDVIALYYVLEHMRDPIDYLHQMQSHLKPGGRLLLEVPNVDDALLSLYAVPAFGPFYWQKAHYQNFSQKTLGLVLGRANYDATMFPVQRYDLSNHMVWMMEGRPGGYGRFRNVFTKEVEAAYAEALKTHWVCDTVFAVATSRPGGGR